MEVQFEGTVNGEKFTDLESFVDALNSLKNNKEDKNISLSYRTSWGDKESKETIKDSLSRLFKSKEEAKLNLIDPNKICVDVESQLDRLTGESSDDILLNELDEYLEDKYTKFDAMLTEDQAHGYKIINDREWNQCNELYDCTAQKIKEISQQIEEIEKQLDPLYKSLRICQNAEVALESIRDYHEDIGNLVNAF